MFLLDTDTCIHLLRARQVTLDKYEAHGLSASFLSSITYHELLYGALHSGDVSKHLQVLANFVKPLSILPFTHTSASQSAQIRQDLAARGEMIGPLDTLIAGHALDHGLIVVTGNVTEFSRVKGLEVENWS